MEKLNSKSLAFIDEVVEKHKDEMGPIKLMLHEIQDELGYIPFEAMEAISKATGEPIAKIYGVVTFYTQFTTMPKGKHVINVCLGTACYVRGSQAILDGLVDLTGAKVNSTSDDGIFSIDATRCVGACGLAPVVSIDGVVYGNVGSINELVETVMNLKNGAA